MTDTNEFNVTFNFSVKYKTDDFPNCATVKDCMTEIHRRINQDEEGTFGAGRSAVFEEFLSTLPYLIAYGVHLDEWHRDDKTEYAFLSGNLGQPGEIHLRGSWWPDIEEDEEGLHPFIAETCEGEEFGGMFLVRDNQVHNYTETDN